MVCADEKIPSLEDGDPLSEDRICSWDSLLNR